MTSHDRCRLGAALSRSESTGGMLDHRSRRDRRELAHAGAHARAGECAAVVKADGYGCGLEPVARALAKAGCKTFFVADLAEARRARALAPRGRRSMCSTASCPGRRLPSPRSTAPGDRQHRRARRMGRVRRRARLARRRGAARRHRHEPARLSADEAAALAPRVQTENHGITLVMSHFACAEMPDHPLNAIQIQRFREIRVLFPGIPGLARQFVRHFPRRRPRITIWCGPASRSTASIRRPGSRTRCARASTLKARIVQVRDVDARRDRRLRRHLDREAAAARIAIVALGYADGFLRAASGTDRKAGGAEAIVAGKRCPLAGRVSMDLIGVDVTDCRRRASAAATRSTLLGDDDRRRRARRRAPAPSATRCLTAARPALPSRPSACLNSMPDRSQSPHGCKRAQDPPSSARTAARVYGALAGQVRRLRRVEHARRGRRRATRRRAAVRHARAACSRSSRSRAKRTKRRGSPRASPSSTASPAAGSCAARCCCSAAIRASASRRC